ncbi:carboxy terminal-processing peptidase [Verrucomicrobiaceae bacterium N1E253]|uniref:Carboxy terminal-processing peptidase n=2 Tax=Oceaniferula marina TaxID=2748318 RepID=A0A851GQ72_9BACT|nr:carboxy terminal-processing peptidase [Oceaniferula marina]
MKQSLLKIVASGLLMTLTSVSCVSAKTDFNEVGRQMVIMLRNSHYERFAFDEDLGKRFFDSYFSHLDPSKQYFLESDVEMFRKKYGSNMHQLLIDAQSMTAAKEIYAVYKKRANQRIGYAQELLKNEAEFSFDGDRTVMLSRKDAPWPENEAAAKQVWHDLVEQALLSESLRRENIAALAKKQGKEDPLKGKDAPGKMISLRFERILHGINDVTDEDIADQFFSAVAKSYDPHTDYFSKSQMERFMSGMQNSLVGIGALLQAEDDGATKITGIVVGGPADKGGELKLNDRIVGVDTLNKGTTEAMEDIMFAKLDHVVDIIRGKAGTEVRLKVEPAAGAPGEIKFIVIKRGKVELKDELAKAELVEMARPDGAKRRLGWISLPSFYADFKDWKTRCSIDIEELVLRLKEEQAEGIILDLRGNGGGSLEEVRRMTGFFTGSGPVVQVKNTQGRVEFKDSSHPKPIYDGPIVVLIDKTSASASEILAGALQDYNRAVVVGDTSSFGKGTVQQPMEIRRMMPFMSDARRAGVLKPTIQKFYRVSGSTTQLKGVESDIVLPSLLDAFEIGEKYLDHAMAHDSIRRAPGFRELNRGNLFLPTIKSQSQARVTASQDFKYIAEDAKRMIERREKNELSLNKELRKKELDEAEQRTNTRNEERKLRFSKVAEEDKKTFRFFRLNLDDLKNKELVEIDRKKDKESYMHMAKDNVADLDETPEWPSSLDPVKREAISILADLVESTERARMAGALQNNNS